MNSTGPESKMTISRVNDDSHTLHGRGFLGHLVCDLSSQLGLLARTQDCTVQAENLPCDCSPLALGLAVLALAHGHSSPIGTWKGPSLTDVHNKSLFHTQS